jgi:hypothetical protein
MMLIAVIKNAVIVIFDIITIVAAIGVFAIIMERFTVTFIKLEDKNNE